MADLALCYKIERTHAHTHTLSIGHSLKAATARPYYIIYLYFMRDIVGLNDAPTSIALDVVFFCSHLLRVFIYFPREHDVNTAGVGMVVPAIVSA